MSPHGVVDRPGPFCTIQDLGRRTGRRAGLAPGGAMDQRAYLWANRLLGNEPAAPALEITLGGFALRFAAATVVAITGEGCAATLDGVETRAWRTVHAQPGQQLRLGYGSTGMRTYIAFPGGLEATTAFGSASAVVRDGLPGLLGRCLRPGRAVALARPRLPVSGPAPSRRTDSACTRFAFLAAGHRLRMARLRGRRPPAGVRRRMDRGSRERPHGDPPGRSRSHHRSARTRFDPPSWMAPSRSPATACPSYSCATDRR